jgi:hypothetical protein
MHECPLCGEVCDCDLDDTWGLPVPAKCPHVCEEDSDEDWYGFEDDESLYCPYCGKDYTDSTVIGCPTCDPRARGEE